MCRRILAASPTGLTLTLDRARNDVLSQKPLTWYRDISLAGLVETLADAQLFGIGEKVATDVMARVGLFEQAMTGYDPSESMGPHEQLVKAAKEKNRWTPLVTGGVVLLDEIGDLTGTLQAKLLRVLNGEKQYRVGKEGNEAFAFQYRGMTVLATWRNLAESKDFRPDLWQRICQNRLRVPSLSNYSIKNRVQLIRSIHRQFQDQMIDELERLRDLSKSAKSEICSTDWLVRLARISKQGLAPETEIELSNLDLGSLGEFRGLKNVIFRTMLGASVVEAARAAEVHAERSENSDGSSGSQPLAVLAHVLEAETVSLGWRHYRLEWAKQINEMLIMHSLPAEDLIQQAGKTRAEVKKQIENILRAESSGTALINE